MGSKRWNTKAEKIEARRHEIIESLPEFDSIYRAVEKWAQELECSENYMRRHITEWRREGLVKNEKRRMSIAEFKHCWSEIYEPVIITVSRVDRFELKPLEKEV